ncbi:MAG: YhbY family RNA-binding protein [Neisseria sp.]|nr:YhbY family RNA-binding protein [Neisseria sp.]
MTAEHPALTAKERQALKQRAHHLNPVVMIGQHGLTEAVLRETDVALKAHELIKIRILNDDRAERAEMAAALCERLNAVLVVQTGKILTVWRERDA